MELTYEIQAYTGSETFRVESANYWTLLRGNLSPERTEKICILSKQVGRKHR